MSLAPQGRFKLKQKDAVVNNKQASWQVQSNPSPLLWLLLYLIAKIESVFTQ